MPPVEVQLQLQLAAAQAELKASKIRMLEAEALAAQLLSMPAKPESSYRSQIVPLFIVILLCLILFRLYSLRCAVTLGLPYLA